MLFSLALIVDVGLLFNLNASYENCFMCNVFDL